MFGITPCSFKAKFGMRMQVVSESTNSVFSPKSPSCGSEKGLYFHQWINLNFNLGVGMMPTFVRTLAFCNICLVAADAGGKAWIEGSRIKKSLRSRFSMQDLNVMFSFGFLHGEGDICGRDVSQMERTRQIAVRPVRE